MIPKMRMNSSYQIVGFQSASSKRSRTVRLFSMWSNAILLDVEMGKITEVVSRSFSLKSVRLKLLAEAAVEYALQ